MSERVTRRALLEGTAAAALSLTFAGCPRRGPKVLEQAQREEAPPPERWCMSVCPYCGVGCGLEVGVAAERVVAVRGMKDHPINEGAMCLLGAKLVEVLDTPDRLLHPQRRSVAGGFERIGWDEATRTAAARIREATSRRGPDSFAMYVSASEYLEEYYVYSKFVKGCLGTNNLESSARLCWASGVSGLVQAFGADAPPCAYDDLEAADLLFVTGYNLSAAKPILYRRLMAARQRTGAKLVVVDPRRTDLAARADLHLQIAPGTDVALHNALVHLLIAAGKVDERQVRAMTEGYDALAAHVKATTPAAAAALTGLPEADLARAARMIGEARAALFLWGQGLNQSRIGTRKVATLLNLVFVSGHVGRPGAGPLAVTGQSSAMALREVGALPHALPGFRHVGDAAARAEVAAAWGLAPDALSPRPGKTLPEILEDVERGGIEVLWIIHSNPAATFPDSTWVERVLAKVPFLIVQDCYHPTETSRHAHLLLPGAQWAEKGGTLTNSERGLNLVEAAVRPPGEARPDLEVVVGVARALGFGERFPYRGTEEVFEEYKRLTRGRPCDIGGVSYARLRRDKGIQWPVPTPEHPGTKRRFLDRRFPRGKVSLRVYEHAPPAEVPDASYPLHLLTGLAPMQFHSRTRTGKVAALVRAAPEPLLEVHPADAQRAGLAEGDEARVTSRRGAVRARVHLSPGIREGVVFLPYHFGALAGPERAVNALTLRAFDEHARQPELKACAVRLEKV